MTEEMFDIDEIEEALEENKECDEEFNFP